MIRKLAALGALLLLAGCAAQTRAHGPAPVAPGVPLPPSPPRGEPDRYSNISGDRLRVLLGSPAFIRKDGATEMWRYDAGNCHAFFFLYGAGAQQQVRHKQVRHIETTPQGKNEAADPACLNALTKRP